MQRLIFLALPILLLTSAAAAEGKPGTDLRLLVGSDVGLCLEFHDLAGTRKAAIKSEPIQRLIRTNLFQFLKGTEPFRGMKKVRRDIEALTGKPLPEFFDAVVGNSVILAVYPSGTKEPAGVLISETSDPEVIKKTIANWKRHDKQLTSTVIAFGKSRYIRLGREKDPRPLYYAFLNTVFVLTDREAVVRKVIKLSQSAPGGKDTLNAVPAYVAARKSLRGKPAATAFINPRAWDAALKIDADSASSERIPAAIWKSCRWVMGSLRIEHGAVFDVVVQFDPKSLPEESRKALKRIDGEPGMLNRIPANAIVAVAGRFDPTGLTNVMQTIGEGPNAGDLKKIRGVAKALLHFDPVTYALPRLKENYAFFIVGRSAKDGRVPIEGLAAVELTPDKSHDKLESGLANVLRYLVTSYNLQAAMKEDMPLATAKSRNTKAVSMHWAETLASYRPGFGIANNFLAVASDPNLIEQFAGDTGKRLKDAAAFKAWRTRYFAEHQQIGFLNFAALRAHVKANRAYFLNKWAKPDASNAAAAGKRLDGVIEALGIVDGAFSAVHTANARLRITFGAVTNKK